MTPSPRSTDRSTDRTALITHAYADNSRLDARRRLYADARPFRDLPGLALSLLPTAPSGPSDAPRPVILDAGCGDGRYTARIREARPEATVLALDLSAGMLRTVAAPRAAADITRLPLPDGCVDAALAMHMLYHVPDPDAALAELRRVLRPGGTLLVSTNARADKRELAAIREAAAAGLAGVRPYSDPALRFPLDDAPERLARHFTRIDTRLMDLHSTVELADPAPALAHLASTLRLPTDSGTAPGVPGPGAAADRKLLRRAEELIGAAIARDGSFTITARPGILSARAPGGTPRR